MMATIYTPLLSNYNDIQLWDVCKRAFHKAFVSQQPITICKLMKWGSKRSIVVAEICGAVMNMSFVLLMLFFDYAALIATLGIKLKISDDANIGIKISILITKLLYDFVGAMGIAYSEIEEKKRDREQAERDREQAERDREQAEQRHREIIAALSTQTGIISNDQLNNVVRDFRKSVFDEHRSCIIKQICNTTVEQIDKLDVMYRYDLEAQLTQQELSQQPL